MPDIKPVYYQQDSQGRQIPVYNHASPGLSGAIYDLVASVSKAIAPRAITERRQAIDQAVDQATNKAHGGAVLRKLEAKYVKNKKEAKHNFVKENQALAPVQPVPLDRLTHNRVLDDGHVDRIAQSMQNGEGMPPIIIDSAGNILDGNHRAAAAAKLGHTHIPAHEVHDKDTGPQFVKGGSTQDEPESGIPLTALIDDPDDLTAPLPTHIGNGSIIDHLASAIQQNPEAADVLKAHALALLRANLAAAHAIHTLTGDPSAFGHYSNGMRVLNEALGGGDTGITEQMVAEQAGGGTEGRALAPIATEIANSVAGPRGP